MDDLDYQPPFKFIGKLYKITPTIGRPQLTPEDQEKLVGGAIQVRLSESSCYLRPGAEIEERGGCREHYDSARRMSPVRIKMVQEKRSYPYRETKPPL